MSPREFSGTEDVAFNYQLPDHSNKLWRSFHSQWQASQFCDLKVVTTNGIVSMHACVWAAFTDHTTNMVQQDSEFRLSVSLAVSSEVVMEIATALYTGTFSPPKNLLAQLYSTTKLIGCSDLHDLISQHCQENSIDLIEECGPTNSQHCQANSIDLIGPCGPTNSQQCQENTIEPNGKSDTTNSQQCQENTIEPNGESDRTNSQQCQENTIEPNGESDRTNSQQCQENTIEPNGKSDTTNSQQCQENTIEPNGESDRTNSQQCQENTIEPNGESDRTNSQQCQSYSIYLIEECGAVDQIDKFKKVENVTKSMSHQPHQPIKQCINMKHKKNGTQIYRISPPYNPFKQKANMGNRKIRTQIYRIHVPPAKETLKGKTNMENKNMTTEINRTQSSKIFRCEHSDSIATGMNLTSIKTTPPGESPPQVIFSEKKMSEELMNTEWLKTEEGIDLVSEDDKREEDKNVVSEADETIEEINAVSVDCKIEEDVDLMSEDDKTEGDVDLVSEDDKTEGDVDLVSEDDKTEGDVDLIPEGNYSTEAIDQVLENNDLAKSTPLSHRFTGLWSKKRVMINQVKHSPQIPNSGCKKIRFRYLIGTNRNQINSSVQQMWPHSILDRNGRYFDPKKTESRLNSLTNTNVLTSSNVTDFSRNKLCPENTQNDADVPNPLPPKPQSYTGSWSKTRVRINCIKLGTEGCPQTTKTGFRKIRIRHLKNINEDQVASIYAKTNSSASIQEIGKKSDILNNILQTYQMQYKNLRKSCDLQYKNLRKSCDLQLSSTVRQERAKLQEPLMSVLEEIDSTLASPSEVAKLFNCFVPLKNFPMSKKKQDYSLQYTNGSVQRASASAGAEDENGAFDADSEDDAFIPNNTEKTMNALQNLSQCKLLHSSVKNEQKRSKQPKSSQNNGRTALKKGKNVSDPKKTARADDQTVEIITEKQSTQSTKSSNSACKRKKSSCTVDGGLFGDMSHMQCPTEKEPQPKRSRTATPPSAQSLGPSQLNYFNGGSQESTPLCFHVSQDEDLDLQNVESVFSTPETNNVRRENVQAEGALSLTPGLLRLRCSADQSKLAFLLDQLDKMSSPSSSSRQTCPICQQVFVNKISLSKHLFNFHETHPILRQCIYCGYVAKTDPEMEQHSIKHHEDKFPFKCPFENCLYSAMKREKIVRHMYAHVTVKTLSCTKCSRLFKTTHHLRSHMRSCTNQRAHVCDFCGKRFNFKESLKKHVNNIHKRIKEHLCTHCGKMFSDKNNLKRHLLIHNDNFPYSCDFCSAKFRHSNTLKGHLKTKHNIDKCEPKNDP